MSRTPEQWNTVCDLAEASFKALAMAMGESIKMHDDDDEMVEIPREAALNMVDFFINIRQFISEVRTELGEK